MKLRVRSWIFATCLGWASVSGTALAQEPQELLGIGRLFEQPNLASLVELDATQLQGFETWRTARLEAAQAMLGESGPADPEARSAALRSFTEASNRELAALLRADQLQVLEWVEAARTGVDGLANPSVVTGLKLSADQQKAIGELLAKRKSELDADPGLNRSVVDSRYGLLLQKILSPSQLAAWRVLSLDVAGDLPEIEAPVAAEVAVTAASPQAAPTAASQGETRINFSFGKMDWDELIAWFAEQADLSLQIETTLPDGTFTYQDPRDYTVAEGIDLLNNVLMLKGVTLVRNGSQLMVVDLERIPEQLIPTISPDELASRGKYEIVSCVFALAFARADDLEPEVRDLVNRDYGKTVAVKLANQLVVRETVGNLRAINAIVEDAEQRARSQQQPVQSVTLQYITTDEAMVLIRSLFGIDANKFSDEDDSIWISPDTLGIRLYYRGDEDKVDRLMQLLQVADRAGLEDPNRAADEFKLRTYAVKGDPANVLKVLQTILADRHPNLRVDVSLATQAVVVYGRDSDHALTASTIEQMEMNAIEFGVIDLRDYDPEDVVEMLRTAFGVQEESASSSSTSSSSSSTGSTSSTSNSYAPRVVVDSTRNRLVVRGTASQVAEITRFVEQLDPPRGGNLARSRSRLLPLTGSEASTALDRVGVLWSTTSRPNRLTFKVVGESQPRIRAREVPTADPAIMAPREESTTPETVTPATVTPATTQPAANSEPASVEAELPAREEEPAAPQAAPSTGPSAGRLIPLDLEEVRRLLRERAEAEGNRGSQNAPESTDPVTPPQTQASGLTASWKWVSLTQEPSSDDTPAAAPATAPQSETSQENQRETINIDGAEIVIEQTPYGIIIRSDDLDALDDLEDLIRESASLEDAVPIPTVYYLRNRKAEEAQQLLSEMLGLSTGSSGGGGGLGGMLGGIAGNMIGGGMGDMVGGLLGGGGGGSSSGTSMFLETTGDVGMVADPKLNALIVQANEEDLKLIEDLLEYLDQEQGPVSPNLEGKTRLIPIVYQNAADVATIVKEQLADFVKGSGGDGGGNPQAAQMQAQQQFLQQLLGGGRRGRGGGGGGGGGGGAEVELQKIAISVEPKTNSLVVTGPDYLYEKVVEIVKQLDLPEIASNEHIEIIRLNNNVKPELLRESLATIFQVPVTGSTNSSANPSAADQARRDAMRAMFQGGGMQGGGGFQGGAGGFRGAGGFPGGGGGFPGGGFPGGGGFQGGGGFPGGGFPGMQGGGGNRGGGGGNRGGGGRGR